MRILHISDLHACAKEMADRRKLVGAMLVDVLALNAERPVDLVVFSGDLADRGGSEELELAEELLLAPLLEKLGLEPERLILVPGNHDVERSRIRALVERGLADGLGSRDEVNRFLEDERDVADALERLASWREFVAKHGYGPTEEEQAGATASARVLSLNGKSVGVALLNSAWRCSGEDDRASLLVGARDAEAALQAIGECDVRLAVMHHPLDWLCGFEADALQAEFEAQGAIVLSGHEHDPNPSAQKSPRGEALYLRTGCLYSHREYPNGYFVIDADPDDRKVVVQIRRWSSRVGAFDAATEIARGGTIEFDLPKVGGATDLGHPPFSAVMRAIVEAAAELRVLPEDMSATSAEPSSIEELLIAPRHLSVPYREAQGMATISHGVRKHEVDATDELLDADVLVVSGDRQSGVSSSLFWLLSQAYRRDASKMPAYMRLGEARLGPAREKASLSKAAFRFGLRKSDAPDPDLLLAVDDVDPDAGRKLERLVKLIAANPRHRYILGCESDATAAVAEALDDAGVSYKRVYLAPFGRTELRKLAGTIARGANADIEQIYGLIMGQSLPATPFTMVALITVMSANVITTTADINESNLLEAFVNLLLGSGELADLEQLGMDLRKRVHLLGELARALYDRPGHSMPVPHAEELLLDYFKRKGLQIGASQVLGSLVARHVLKIDHGEVSFSNPALLDLFLGQWMLEDEAHKQEMLSDCAKNGAAIVHAAGLRRTDRELLAKVGESTGAVIGAIAAKLPRSRVDHLLEAFAALDAWSPERLEETLARLPERKTDSEIDEELDRLSEALGGDDDKLESPALEVLATLEEATTLLSNVLRNSELVDDVDLKRALFEMAIEGWVLVIGAVMAEDADEESIRGLVEEYVGERAEDAEQAELISRLILVLLIVISAARAQARLGSKHLAITIEGCLDNEEFTASATAHCLAVWIEAALEMPELPDRLDALLSRLTPSSFLRNATIAIAVARYRSQHDETAARKIESVLARHMVSVPKVGWSTALQRNAATANVAKRLRQSRRAFQQGTSETVKALAEKPPDTRPLDSAISTR